VSFAPAAGGQTAARVLAVYAASLRADALPSAVVARARQCIVDTVGASLFGAGLPWGRIAAGFARQQGGAGGAPCRVIGTDVRASSAHAALANGVLAHAFELDSLRKPGAGVHPGATLWPAALAIGEELGADGRSLLVAFVAGCEVMFRIGVASRHSSETLGFHAPGLTGPYGAAVVACHLLGLDADRTCNALGIAGSLGGGLLAFAKAGNGAMVKRLHMGRAAEAGVLAARLAAEGYEGPDTVLEGRFGFLEAYCRDGDASRLVRGLGSEHETLTICFKRYGCHVTAHTPVQSLLELRAEAGFDGDAVAALAIEAGPKVLSHHANAAPVDLAGAQYSVPFCAALALYDDPTDPSVFSMARVEDPRIRAAALRIELEPFADEMPGRSAWASRVRVVLKDGRRFERYADDFRGTPASPLSDDEMAGKFLRMAGGFPSAGRLLEQLMALESLDDCRRLQLAASVTSAADESPRRQN
jgi:2-methylcitrate dehydratase PrpD